MFFWSVFGTDLQNCPQQVRVPSPNHTTVGSEDSGQTVEIWVNFGTKKQTHPESLLWDEKADTSGKPSVQMKLKRVLRFTQLPDH